MTLADGAAAGRSLPLRASLLGHACLLAAALRHDFFWGSSAITGVDLAPWLGALEGLALVAFALIAGVAYARVAARAGTFDARAVFRSGAIVLLFATAIPPFLSSDVWDNLARGRVEAVHHANPYSMPAGQFPEDPFTRAAEWTSFGNPYGPLSTAVQSAVCLLCGDSPWLGAYLMKALCALCHLLTAWLVYRAVLILAPPRAAHAAFLYLWNPWILVETAGSAHNDALAAVGLAGMAWALAARRMLPATVAFGMAVLVKHGNAVLGPLLLALAWRRRELRAFGGGVLCCAAITALFALRYFLEDGAVQALLAQVAHQRTSLQSFAALLFAPERGAALTMGGMILTALYVLLLLPGVRDVESFAQRAVKLVVFFLLFGMPMFSPWYHLWWLPLAALDARNARVFAWVAVLVPLSYLVAVVTRSFEVDHQFWQWGLALLPVAVLVLVRRR